VIAIPESGSMALSKSRDINPTLFQPRENHRSFRKDLLAVLLDKDGRRRADTHNYVRRAFAI
jgi:hypothetical protein